MYHLFSKFSLVVCILVGFVLGEDSLKVVVRVFRISLIWYISRNSIIIMIILSKKKVKVVLSSMGKFLTPSTYTFTIDGNVE